MANTPIAGIPAERIAKLDRAAMEGISTENRLKAIFEIWWFLVHEREAPTFLQIRNHVVDKIGVLVCDEFIKNAVNLSDHHAMVQGKAVRV